MEGCLYGSHVFAKVRRPFNLSTSSTKVFILSLWVRTKELTNFVFPSCNFDEKISHDRKKHSLISSNSSSPAPESESSSKNVNSATESSDSKSSEGGVPNGLSLTASELSDPSCGNQLRYLSRIRRSGLLQKGACRCLWIFLLSAALRFCGTGSKQ